MSKLPQHSDKPVTLVGGGPVTARDLRLALRRAPKLFAADGGADRLLHLGHMPAAVFGDMDSLSPDARKRIPAAHLHLIGEQATTDFDKALRSIDAPLLLCLGFAGARSDHALAVMNALIRAPHKAAIVIGPKDICFAAPKAPLELQLMPGDLLSLFPFAAVTGQSKGLAWPLAGLDFAPNGFIGTSNRVTERSVQLAFDQPGMLVILPRNRLDAAIAALQRAHFP